MKRAHFTYIDELFAVDLTEVLSGSLVDKTSVSISI